MSAYRLRPFGGVTRILDGAVIPPDPENIDWQTYLAWCAEGNTADPV